MAVILTFDAAGIVLKCNLKNRIACIDGFNGIRKNHDLDKANVIGKFGET